MGDRESRKGGVRGGPIAASLAGVPALRPPRRLLLAQQVGVDEHKELVGVHGGDVALPVHAPFVQQHRIEVGAGETQELPDWVREELGLRLEWGAWRAEPAHPVQQGLCSLGVLAPIASSGLGMLHSDLMGVPHTAQAPPAQQVVAGLVCPQPR